MIFSVRQLLGFVAFFSLAMVLSRFPPHLSFAAILLTIVVPSYFLVSRDNWRRMTYGGVFGIFVAFLIMMSLSFFLYVQVRHIPTNGYDTGLSANEERFRQLLDPFLVPVGFLLGATMFLAIKRNSSHESSLDS